jgi:ribonucleoside-triphosphate reductase
MRERLSDYQEAYGDLYNLEATPAEATSYRLAKHDIKRYPDIKTAAEAGGTPYYTNSSHLPVGYTEDIFAALDVQDELQTLYTSGTVFHAFLGEKLPDWKAAAALVRKISENYKLPYYTLSPTYSVCKNHGYLNGEVFTCPDCGETAEVYSRITGYYRPVQNWNDGKTQEYKQRKTYNVNNSEFKPHAHACGCCDCKEEANVGLADGILLFATKTCPNCRLAASFLDKAGIAYEKVLADDAANEDLCNELEIRQAPTLIVVKGGQVAAKVVNLSNIRKYIEENA